MKKLEKGTYYIMAQQDCYLGGNYGSNVSGIVDYHGFFFERRQFLHDISDP